MIETVNFSFSVIQRIVAVYFLASSFSPEEDIHTLILFSDEDEEAGDEAGLAAQTRGIHQCYPLREGDAGTIGGGWEFE